MATASWGGRRAVLAPMSLAALWLIAVASPVAAGTEPVLRVDLTFTGGCEGSGTLRVIERTDPHPPAITERRVRWSPTEPINGIGFIPTIPDELRVQLIRGEEVLLDRVVPATLSESLDDELVLAETVECAPMPDTATAAPLPDNDREGTLGALLSVLVGVLTVPFVRRRLLASRETARPGGDMAR